MSEHTVQFYEKDAFLIEGVADFIHAGLADGRVCIAIASADHLRALQTSLARQQRSRGDELPCASRFTAIDAQTVLPLFMLDGTLDDGRFIDVMGGILRDACVHAGHGTAGPIYLYSEMAAELVSCDPGTVRSCAERTAVLQLECALQHLQQLYPLTLLCGFPIAAFSGEHDTPAFQELCRLHSCTRPTEAFRLDLGLAEQLGVIAALQQQALALSFETVRRREAEGALQAANFDPLTGLPNRTVFQDRLAVELKKAQRTRLPLALLFVDLDFFKQVNDNLGHDRGDVLLTQVGQRLASCVRQGDTVARLGGDEFTVILPELSDHASVSRVAETILFQMSEPFDLGSEVVYISASIGIAFYPQDAGDIHQLLQRADQAMYAAKSKGGNRAAYFTHSMHEAAQQRLLLAADMRHALSERQLRLFYQPVFDLHSGKVEHAEALLRWQHPLRGLLRPTDFLTLAEHTGLILPIGEWVLSQAMRQATRWRRIEPDFQVSVNLSPAQFHPENSSRNHAGRWIGRLKRQSRQHPAGIPEVRLEVSPRLLQDGSLQVEHGLMELRRSGIQFSIDNYGGGAMALAEIRKFEIDHLKIDRRFVLALDDDPHQACFCQAIILMAHTLGLKVVAEGVQTESQHEWLREAGCDLAQGFWYAKPMDAPEFEAFLLGANETGAVMGLSH